MGIDTNGLIVMTLLCIIKGLNLPLSKNSECCFLLLTNTTYDFEFEVLGESEK